MSFNQATTSEAVSRTTEDHLKAIWSALEWGGDPATIRGLAERFGTTAASASSTVKRLVGQGLLTHEPYGPIILTPEGEQLAVGMVRRHRLIETYLVNQLGYGWDEVHDEAENLEHAASDLLIDRIDDLLGHPVADPHGDPIPDRRGRVVYPVGAHRLSTAAPGDYRVVRVSDESANRLLWFDAVGIGVGAALTIPTKEREELEVLVNGGRIPVPEASADAIIVVKDRALRRKSD